MKTLMKLATVAALCATTMIVPASARVFVGVGINLTPPAPRMEVRPVAPWHDGVWIDGHWGRRDGDWVWKPGHWARGGGHAGWIPGHYDRRGEWIEGHWR
jgi:hypothetical protein